MKILVDRFQSYSRFVKIEHTLFSVPLLFSGALLANHRLPPWPLWALILGAGLGARTAAFSLNRIIDRHIDRRNPRTAHRELPQGTLTLTEAWGIFAAGTLLYETCAWAIAPICFYLSPIPLLIFVIYPYLKRWTPLAHFGVGLADAMAPLGGWMAVTQSFHPFWPGFWLALFTFFWVSGFDIIYATLDEKFDRDEGLHSWPAEWGSEQALRLSGLLHMAAFGALVVLYQHHLRSPIAFITLAAIGVLLYLEHMLADDVELAFFKINAVLGFGVLGFVAVGFMGKL